MEIPIRSCCSAYHLWEGVPFAKLVEQMAP